MNQGLWWDEAVYLGLGRNIQKGIYSLDHGKPLETFRPPLFPILLSPFSGDILLARIFVVALSVLSVISVYFLSRKFFGQDVALWASLFLSTGQLFVFFSTKVLTEPLFMIFLSFSLVFFFREERYSTFISGVFAGLAFLTRYLGTILAISFIIYFFYLALKNKDKVNLTKRFLLLFAGIFIVLLPWLLMSQAYYGDILGAYKANIFEYSDEGRIFGSYVENMLRDSANMFYDFSRIFGFPIFFVVLGMYVMIRKTTAENRILLLSLFILPVLFYLIAPYREPRYLLSYAPIYAVFFGLALKDLKAAARRWIPFLAVLACSLSVLAGFSDVWNDRFGAKGLVDAAVYIKGLTGENDVVMSQSYPYVYYLSERRAVVFPRRAEWLEGTIEENNIRHVLLYKFEPKNPEYVNDYFDKNDDFELVEKFEQWGDPEGARIYRLIS